MFLFDKSPADIKAELIEQLADQADWRRRVAQRFPDDPRNLRSAEVCGQLANRFQDLPDTDPGLRLLFDAHHLWVGVMSAFEEADAFEVEQMDFDRAEAENFMWREIGFHVKYSRFCLLKELAEIYLTGFDEAEDAVFEVAQARGLDELRDRLARLEPAEIDAPEAAVLARDQAHASI